MLSKIMGWASQISGKRQVVRFEAPFIEVDEAAGNTARCEFEQAVDDLQAQINHLKDEVSALQDDAGDREHQIARAISRAIHEYDTALPGRIAGMVDKRARRTDA